MHRRQHRRPRGPTLAIAPGTAAVKHLRYGRSALAAEDAPLAVDTGRLETGLIALAGEATVTPGTMLAVDGGWLSR